MQSVGLREGRGCRAPSCQGAPEPAWRQSCLQLVSLRRLPVAAQVYTTHSTISSCMDMLHMRAVMGTP